VESFSCRVAGVAAKSTLGYFSVALRPNPFPLDAHFSLFVVEPHFEHANVFFTPDHIELRFAQEPPVELGQAVTIHYEFRLLA
jgi:hypothetical protein